MIICFAIGTMAVLFVFTTIYLAAKYVRVTKQCQDCTAVVKEVKEVPSYGMDFSIQLIPVAEYTVNGNTYIHPIPFYSTKPKAGDTVKILTKKDAPTDIHTKQSLIVPPIITGITSIIFFATTFIIYIILHSQA